MGKREEKKEEKKNIIADTLGIRRPDEIEDEKQLPTVVENEKHLPSTEVSDQTHEVIRDIDLAKSNIQNIIQQGDDALSEMMELAKQSESPRAFEVASTLMKTLLDANKDFVDLSNAKLKAKIDLGGGNKSETNVTNNNLVVSTTDLLKMLKGEVGD